MSCSSCSVGDKDESTDECNIKDDSEIAEENVASKAESEDDAKKCIDT